MPTWVSGFVVFSKKTFPVRSFATFTVYFLMIPFCRSEDGGSQDIVTVVDVTEVKMRLVGDAEGPG